MRLPNGKDYNLTYNLYEMLCKAFDREDWKEIQHLPIKELNNETAYAIVKMEFNEDEFKKLNPKNGWGDYDGCLKFLYTLYKASAEEDATELIIM